MTPTRSLDVGRGNLRGTEVLAFERWRLALVRSCHRQSERTGGNHVRIATP